MLEAIILDTYPEGTETARSSIRVFDLEIDSMMLTKTEGFSQSEGIYGTLKANVVHPKPPLVGSKENVAFSRSKDPGARVTMALNTSFGLDGGKRYRYVYPRTEKAPTFDIQAASLKVYYLMTEPRLLGSTVCDPGDVSDELDPSYGAWKNFSFDATHDQKGPWTVEITGRCREVPRWLVPKEEWSKYEQVYARAPK